jgi:hypothetical protein
MAKILLLEGFMETEKRSTELKHIAEESAPSVVVRLKINEAPEILVTDLNCLQEIIGSDNDGAENDD